MHHRDTGARLGRREWLRRTLAASVGALGAISALGALLQGCGDESIGTPVANCSGVAQTGFDLHYHTTCLPQSILDSPQTTNLVTMQDSGTLHTHTVTLTQQQVIDIGNGMMVIVTSSLSGHTHQVQFN